jgi:predicted PurR-regulated permease PerM
MSTPEAALRKALSEDLLETLFRFGLIVFLAVMCARVFAPFASLMIWGLILAVALEPLNAKLAKRLGGRRGLAATVLTLVGLLLLGVPTVMLGNSFATHVQEVAASAQDGTLHIPPPGPGVAGWPIVGKKIDAVWNSAADNLPAFVSQNREKLKDLSRKGLAAAASTAVAVLLFIGALIVAAIMLAYAESGNRAMTRIFSRLTDPVRGPRLQKLATATVRSVASGVIGVAFIQAILLGMGFMFAGIPAAGVLALLVMFLGILQVPALLVSLPAIAWLWVSGDGSTTSNIAFTIYLGIAGMADNVLKPLLLGRGVDAPMPVILIGALGGMVTGGIIGLFVGGVLLAVGYQLFMEWVDDIEPAAAQKPEAT